MPKRTVILIVILTLLTGVLVFLAMKNERQDLPPESDVADAPFDAPQQLEKTATIVFEPTTVEAVPSTASASTVDVFFDSTEHTVDNIQLELQYDPEVLTNVSITAPAINFFGEAGSYVVPIQTVDRALGRISYAIAINPQVDAVRGVGQIAQISFSVNPQATVSETQIKVLDRSMANETTSHESVLAPVDPLIITIAR